MRETPSVITGFEYVRGPGAKEGRQPPEVGKDKEPDSLSRVLRMEHIPANTLT